MLTKNIYRGNVLPKDGRGYLVNMIRSQRSPQYMPARVRGLPSFLPKRRKLFSNKKKNTEVRQKVNVAKGYL